MACLSIFCQSSSYSHESQDEAESLGDESPERRRERKKEIEREEDEEEIGIDREGTSNKELLTRLC